MFGPILAGKAHSWLVTHDYSQEGLRELAAVVAMGGAETLGEQDAVAVMLALAAPAFLLGAVTIERTD